MSFNPRLPSYSRPASASSSQRATSKAPSAPKHERPKAFFSPLAQTSAALQGPTLHPAGCRPDDSAATEDYMEATFLEILNSFQVEQGSFSSFSNACELALSRAEVASATLASPKQLETSVAASLLLKVTQNLGSYGPLVHRLVVRLIEGAFDDGLPSTILRSTPERAPSNEQLSELVRRLSFGSQCKALAAKAARYEAALAKAKQTLMFNTSHFFSLAGKNSEERVRLCFRSWKDLTKKSLHLEIHLCNFTRLQRNTSRKREALLRWCSFVYFSKESRTVMLASQNHEKLRGRLAEVTSRCTQREEQMAAQRTAKEKFSARCDRLEELYSFEKEELAKCRTRLLSTDQEVQRFRRLAASVFHVVDRLTATIPLAAVSLLSTAEVAHTSWKRDLNIKGRGTHSNRLLVNNTYDVPYFVHGGGGACLEDYVDDVYLVVLRWLNAAKAEVRQFVESTRAQLLSESKDPFALTADFATSATMTTDPTTPTTAAVNNLDEESDVLRAWNEFDLVQKPVTDLGRDLADGRVYQLLLWRTVCHRYRQSPFLKGAHVAPFVLFESSIERMEHVLCMAQLLGIRCGVSAADLIESGGSARRHHFLFCSRLLGLQCSLTPHVTSVSATRSENTSGSATMTTSHLQQWIATASERVDALERWSVISRIVSSYANEVATGVAALDTGSHRSPTCDQEFFVEKSLISAHVTPANLKFAKPARLDAGAVGQPQRPEQGQSVTDDATTAALGGAAGAAAAATFLAQEMSHLLSTHRQELLRIEWYYAALTSSDVPDCVWDTPAWFRFVQDAKLVTNKHVTRPVSDAVFRSLAAPNPAVAAAAVVMLQPPQLQPRLSSAGTGFSRRSVTADDGSVQAGDLEGDGALGSGGGGAVGGTPYLMPVNKLAVAIARLFFARSLNPPNAALAWTDVDRAVELFREFLTTVVLATSVGRTPAFQLLANYQHPTVQEVLQSNKDVLRKIFTELSSRDASTQLSRLRLDAFVHFFTRDAKVLPSSDAGELPCVYQTCRIASSTLSPLKSAALTVPGLDLAGFHLALIVFSRVKFGFPLISHASALQQFLNVVLFPASQFKFKLKTTC